MFRKLLLVGVAIAAAIYIISCSSSSGGTSVASYQGAGSKWAASFSGGSFTLNHFNLVTDTTPDMTISGTYEDYSTGFRFLTVAAASGAGAPSVGAQAYGFEVPGFAFFLKPAGSNTSEPIVMIQAGACPTSGFDANWIIASFDSSVTMNSSKDSFGHASFTMNGASSSASIYQHNAENGGALNGGVPQVSPFDYTTCSNGVLTFSTGADTVDMFFTSSGGALVHSYDGGSHDNIIFAAPKHTTAVTQTELAGTYSAIVFDDTSSGDKIFPMKFVIPASGAASVNRISDVETDALTSDPTIPITSFTAISASPGLFTAVIDATGTNGRMSCTFIPVGSTKVIACNGYGQNSDRTAPFFLLAKSR